jgi:sec-independent protein translocase protein TatA
MFVMTLAIFQSVGPLELLIVLGIVLVIFGPKRLPGLGRQLGTGMREFKDSLIGKSDDDDDDAAEGSRPERETREPEPVEAEVVSEKP